MAQFRFIAISLVTAFAVIGCADAETGLGGSPPSNGGESGEGANSQGGAPGQGAGPSDGGAPGQTVTNNTATNNTVTNGTVTSAGPTTTTSGGTCEQFACIAQCLPTGELGTCVGGVCECGGGFPSGSSGSGFGGGFGFGGAFP